MASSTDFDGSTDALYVASSSGSGNVTNITGQDFSFVAWVYPDAVSGTIVARRDGGTIQYQMFHQNTQLGMNPGSITLGTSVATGAWNHCAIVGSSTNVEGFVDGVSQGTASAQTLSHQSVDLIIGARWNTAPAIGFAHNGELAHVSIHDVRLTQSEILEMMWNPGSIRRGLIGYWPLYDGNWADVSGNGLDLTAVGTPALDSNAPPI